MSKGIRVRIDGRDEARAELAGMAERAEHPRGMWAEIGAALVTSTQERFERGAGPDGSPWPPSIRALATGGKTLVDTARLVQSQTYRASDSGVEVGTNVLYAAIQQLGGTIQQAARDQVINFKQHARTGKLLKGFRKASKATLSRKVHVGARTITIPARPFLGLDDNDEREIVTIGETWLRGEATL